MDPNTGDAVTNINAATRGAGPANAAKDSNMPFVIPAQSTDEIPRAADPIPDDATPPAENEDTDPQAKRKRSRGYTAAQIEIIKKAHLEEKMGYRSICKKSASFGLTESGVQYFFRAEHRVPNT